MNKLSMVLKTDVRVCVRQAQRADRCAPHRFDPCNRARGSRGGWAMRVRNILLACSVVATPAAMAQSRGELLYATHCVACHTTAMHWRDKRSAHDWTSLKLQVRRWQREASLAWSDADILDVSRYLNDSIYHFETTADPATSLSLAGHEEGRSACRSAAGCKDIEVHRLQGRR